MDTINCQHRSLADGGWTKMSFALQMGNLGSEVSRSLKWYGKNEKRFRVSFERALELFDLTIEAACQSDSENATDQGNPSGQTAATQNEPSRSAKLKEVCRAREEFCDYFLGDNSWGTDPVKMQRYYDQFAILGRKDHNIT